MVSYTNILASNARISSKLPARIVAVFVGATSGIGEFSVKSFAKNVLQPRIYIVGRSQESADRIIAECKTLNPQGEYFFLKTDSSLIKNVDDVCREIKSKEKSINVLFNSMGTLLSGTKTSEGLHYAMALGVYGRNRFIQNLLPLLSQAQSIRRVITVFAGTKEGPIYANDFQGWNVPLRKGRGHATAMATFSLEALAKKAPHVSFIHDYPGLVKTNIIRGGEGVMIAFAGVFLRLFGSLILNDMTKECGERHTFLATSAKYPSRVHGDGNVNLALDKIQIANGTDGKSGSGVYTVDEYCESAGTEVVKMLAGMRDEGMVDKVWGHMEEEFERITGRKDGI